MDTLEIITLLQQERINPTKQRIEIASLLFSHPQHLSAEQLIKALGDSSISKATVYNTLKLFSQHGLLRELCVDPSRIYYDTNLTPHHHIYNIDTGELWDVMAEGEGLSVPVPSLPQGTQAVGVDLIFRVKTG